MSTSSAWERLQERFARGERLSPEEERERRRYAEDDALAAREIAVFDALAAHTDDSAAASPAACRAVAERALRATRGLRLVATDASRAAKTRRRRSAVWLIPAATACLTALLALVVLREKQPSHPRPQLSERTPPPSERRSELVFVSGELEVDGRPSSAGGQLLRAATRLRTHRGRACLGIDPSIDVCLDGDSELELTSLAGPRIELRVLQGSVAAALATRAAGQSFSLLMGDARATARGTAFVVSYDARPQSVRVTVVEGQVEVKSPTRGELVEPHTRLTWTGAGSGEKSPLGRAEEASSWALLAPRELWQGAGLGVLSVPASAPGTRVWVDELGPFELPLSAFARGRHRLVLVTPNGAEAPLSVNVEAGGRTEVPNADVKPAATPRAGAREAVSATELLDQARQKLRSNDARGATALYERLVTLHPHSVEASTVQVTLGKLQLSQGAPARALQSFERYLAGGGPLSPEALAGKVRALRALGRTQAEQAAIATYLARYPEGFDAESLKARARSLGAP